MGSSFNWLLLLLPALATSLLSKLLDGGRQLWYSANSESGGIDVVVLAADSVPSP